MTHRRSELRISLSSGGEIAATAHLPGRLVAGAPLLFLFPGSGYGRGYFDLPGAGFSQAAAHVANGFVVVAIDPVGVGDSTIPAPEDGTMDRVAASAAEAVDEILGRLCRGDLGEPCQPSAVIAAGQSMGGFIVGAIHARHRSFDGIALLGASAVGTRLPMRPDAPALAVGGDADRLADQAIAGVDWPWAFHWEGEGGHTALAERDIAAGLPRRTGHEAWVSATSPACVRSLMVPGAMAADAERITAPLLLAMGERDVCHSPLVEAAAFPQARDIAMFTVPRMAHMHNFAETRAMLWMRLEQFGLQVAALKAATSMPHTVLG
jgi:pimeloyl-ACP methyl ester carboxylesterase